MVAKVVFFRSASIRVNSNADELRDGSIFTSENYVTATCAVSNTVCHRRAQISHLHILEQLFWRGIGAISVPHVIDQHWWVQQREHNKINEELIQKLEVRHDTKAEPRYCILAFLHHKHISISRIRLQVRKIFFLWTWNAIKLWSWTWFQWCIRIFIWDSLWWSFSIYKLCSRNFSICSVFLVLRDFILMLSFFVVFNLHSISLSQISPFFNGGFLVKAFLNRQQPAKDLT